MSTGNCSDAYGIHLAQAAVDGGAASAWEARNGGMRRARRDSGLLMLGHAGRVLRMLRYSYPHDFEVYLRYIILKKLPGRNIATNIMAPHS